MLKAAEKAHLWLMYRSLNLLKDRADRESTCATGSQSPKIFD